MSTRETLRHKDPKAQAGHTIIYNTILLNPLLSVEARLLYMILKSYAWFGKDDAFPGQETLANLMGVGDRQIRNYRAELEASGLIEKEQRGLGLTNLYLLTDEFNEETWKPWRDAKRDQADRRNAAVQERKKFSGQDRQHVSGHDRQHVSAPDRQHVSGESNEVKPYEVKTPPPTSSVGQTTLQGGGASAPGGGAGAWGEDRDDDDDNGQAWDDLVELPETALALIPGCQVDLDRVVGAGEAWAAGAYEEEHAPLEVLENPDTGAWDRGRGEGGPPTAARPPSGRPSAPQRPSGETMRWEECATELRKLGVEWPTALKNIPVPYELLVKKARQLCLSKKWEPGKAVKWLKEPDNYQSLLVEPAAAAPAPQRVAQDDPPPAVKPPWMPDDAWRQLDPEAKALVTDATYTDGHIECLTPSRTAMLYQCKKRSVKNIIELTELARGTYAGQVA
ncbi:MAG TPA: helix-turn-helix domain-containing protein [Herpetosiphonaceae bacterium]